MSKIKNEILSGVIWTVGNQIGLQILTVIFTGILSRILSPSEFGLIAMVTLATGFLSVLKDFGFGAALVQKKEVSQEEYSSVFWFNMIIGAVLTLAVWLSAPLVAWFFKEPNLKNITHAISFTFVLASAGIVSGNILIKQLEFKQIFYRSLLSTLISGIVAVFLALNGFGYWALIANTYCNLITSAFFTYQRVKWRPSFVLKKQYVVGLMPFSLPLIADQSVNYWTRNVDNLLIGKIYGSTDLAFYTKAYSLMLLPVKQISRTITKVLFPSFSRIQNDIEQIKNVYLKISGLIALITFPLMTYLFLMGREVILMVYGNQWIRSVEVFKILCFLGMLQSIGTLIGNIFISQGKTALLFKIGLFSRTAMILGIVVGLYSGGIKGVAYGYLISSSIALVVETNYVARILKTSLAKIFMNLANKFFCTAIMGLILYGITYIMPGELLLRIIISGLVSFVVYATMLKITNDNSVNSLMFILRERFGNKIFSLKFRR